nr:integrase, catalytic region, zinc finger, CCHC-type, peptidase aspartic, catalytic [Tanacetum cinerariifolium]
MGKSKKEPHPHKPKLSTNEKLQMMHMDLCAPMRVESINGKRYILVIVNDHSQFTWVKFFRTKDEAPEIIIKILKQAQVSLNATVGYLRTDNDTEFINQTIRNYTKDDLGKLKLKQTLVHYAIQHVFGALCYPINDNKDLALPPPDTAEVSSSTTIAQDALSLGIFINQSKYALKMLKKYSLDQCNLVDIPMVESSKLDEDPNETPVDPTHYRGMIGSLMYLTARTINMGLWYPKNTGFDLTTFAYADHACCRDSRKSTSGSAQFLARFLPVKIAYQLADIFTKALPREHFEFLVKRLGMRSITPEELKV